MTDASYYEQAAHWSTGATSDERNLARLDATLDLLAPLAPRVVADAGAGDGALARRAAHRLTGSTIISVERSAAAIAHAPAPRVRASIDALPFRAGAVDVAVACEVIEHLPVDVYRRALSELDRAAGRAVVLTVPNDEDLRRGRTTCPECGCRFHANRHLRAFAPPAFEGLLGSRWRLAFVDAIGPREPAFPRAVTSLAHRLGLASPDAHGGLPECPQCGYGVTRPRRAPGGGGAAGARVRVRRLLRSRLPVPRRQPWLAAVFRPR